MSYERSLEKALEDGISQAQWEELVDGQARIAELEAALVQAQTTEEDAMSRGHAVGFNAGTKVAEDAGTARIAELEAANAALTQLVGRYRTDNSALKAEQDRLKAALDSNQDFWAGECIRREAAARATEQDKAAARITELETMVQNLGNALVRASEDFLKLIAQLESRLQEKPL